MSEEEVENEETINFEPTTIKGKNKVECWSESNGDITPRDVSKTCRKNYIFLCMSILIIGTSQS